MNNNNLKCDVFLGEPNDVSTLTGKVIQTEQWSETHVHGSGGGGQNGHTAPVTVSSTVINKKRIWLEDKNKQEMIWTLTDMDNSERKGHILTMAEIKSKNKSNLIALYNHNLDSFQWMSGNIKNHLKISGKLVWLIILSPAALYFLYHLLISQSNSLGSTLIISVGIILAWGAIFGILLSIFHFIRKMIFTNKYRSKIKELISIKHDLVESW